MGPFRTLALSAVAAVITLAASGAHAQTFSNTAAIAMPTSGTDGRAALYPSTITVSGAPASIVGVNVTLSNLTHNFVGDINVLLVAPGGQRILLMSNTHGTSSSSVPANGETLTFAPSGPPLPTTNDPVVSGTYICSAYNPPANLPSPAPAGPYLTSLVPIIGSDANGVWQLYVWDDFPSLDNGTFAGGWSITFTSAVAPPSTAITYQGRLTIGGAPVNGAANVRFTLCNNEIAPLASAALGTPVSRSFTGIQGGLITTALDFVEALDTDLPLWLNIEVESPPGSGFVTLLPRQPLTPAPKARVAARATLADTAATANQLAPGRQRIRGGLGPVNDSPGIWFASPVASPVDRAFVGQRDDFNVGFFNSGWNFVVNSNGNVAVGDSSGNAPTERLTVNGSIQLNTGTISAPTRLAFGPVGNLTGGAESSDAVYFQRVNVSNDTTDLRLFVGDNPDFAPATSVDAFSIWTNNTVTDGIERFRFESNGNAFKPGGGSWAALSDPRAKHDIAPLAGTLDKLLNLRGYSFLYNDDRIASGLARPGTQIGLMADEVARIFPDWVSTDASGTRYVTERATTALMVEALRDLRAEKDAVAAKADAAQKQLDALKADAAKREADAARRDVENADLKARLERLERLINAMPE
ncbi:MAG: tail fiber domain-containing protein [Phycisphaerales bacterium]|nr:tail fiber domain-containing protein [Phycisphaerales bacterium]